MPAVGRLWPSDGDDDGDGDGNSGSGRDGERAEGGYERADEGGGGGGEVPSVNEKNIFGEFQLKIKIMPCWKVRWKLKIKFAQIMEKLEIAIQKLKSTFVKTQKF